MIGLNLAELVNPKSDGSSVLWQVTFPSVKVVTWCTGATRLANAWLFQLLSSYNPTFKTGSKFRQLVAAPLVRELSSAQVSGAIASEIAQLQERFQALQAASGQTIPPEELLKSASILRISVTGTNAVVEAQLISQANVPVYLEIK